MQDECFSEISTNIKMALNFGQSSTYSINLSDRFQRLSYILTRSGETKSNKLIKIFSAAGCIGTISKTIIEFFQPIFHVAISIDFNVCPKEPFGGRYY